MIPSNLPTVSWICPVYRRTACLPNLIACFLAQDYPPELLNLIVLDDGAQYAPGIAGDRWEVVTIGKRFESLPAKYNALAGLSGAEILIVAEDDDTYLAWHTMAHALTLRKAPHTLSKPARVLSDYPGKLIIEGAHGRFHGSVALTRELWAARDGWPVTDAPNFDQQMIARFSQPDGPSDTTENATPSYVFRWHTGHAHGQSFAVTPDDFGWYRNAAVEPSVCRSEDIVRKIIPSFDPFTRKLYREGVSL